MSLAHLDTGSGSPVILVHGAMADYREWSNQQGPLSQRHRVIAYSRRYHWPNAPPNKDSDGTAERRAEDLAAIIQSLELRPAHIVGHSYGGLVALTLSLRHPEMVRTLVLVEPAVSGVLENAPESKALVNERQAFSDEMRAAFDSGDAERIVKTALSHYAPGEFDDAPAETREMYQANIPAFRLDFNSPRPTLNCEDMQNIAAPALVLAGGRSPKGLQRTAERVAQCLKGRSLAKIPQGTHHSQLNHSQEFNDTVLAFLAKH